jgi:hypothetical protein
LEKQIQTPLNNIFLHKVRMFFVKFITQAKDLCVFFDGSYKKMGRFHLSVLLLIL